MDNFIERQNIAHYLDLLKSEDDQFKREILERLLAEERRKLLGGEIRYGIESRKSSAGRSIASIRS
jgi:hypothetical protein